MVNRFFHCKIGAVEMVMLYGSWISWIITSGLEGVLGKRFLSRIFDTFGGILFIAVATAWLVVVFPFDFTYFSNALPEFLRFLVQWISNDIARIVMVLYAIAMGVAAVYAPIAYKFIKTKRFNLAEKKEV
jgi:type IV secretory pathway VirB2 component (pilin)